MASTKINKILYYFGNAVLLVEVVVLVALAFLVAESHREILEKIIPAKFLTPQLLLVYMLAGLILVKYGSKETPDFAALLEAHTTLQKRTTELEDAKRGRHLTDEDKGEIIRIMGNFLTETLKRWNDPRDEKIAIVVIALGEDPETQNYRDDFVDAFNAAGFDGLSHFWPAGIREHRHFRNAVTLINSTPPGNIWHKPLLSALRAARVSANTADHPWLPDPRFRMEPPLADRPVAYLIVGQRG
jgi:hypothetical protein